MKARKLALIHLKDLPDDGLDFEFTRQTGELNEALKDLVGQNDYRITLHARPMGNTFNIKGEINTELNLQCSMCADDFALPVSLKVNELILIEKALGKNEQNTKVNHAHEWAEGGPDYQILPNEVFNVGEFVHEAIALAEPIRPLCSPQDADGCKHPEHPDRPWLTYGESAGPDIRANPFSALEKIKLKS